MKQAKILYHYTNADGLFGIIDTSKDTNKIWANSYRYMNDSKELEYGFDLIKEIYPRPETYPLQSNLSDYSFAEHLNRKRVNFDSDCLFVASFSTENNLLSQWRAYAGPHSGYAIGFRSNELENDDVRLVECEYNKENQKLYLKKLIDKNLPLLRACFEASLNKHENKEQPDLAGYFKKVDQTVLEIAKSVTSFKHESFREEKEWRLVVGPMDVSTKKILYRPSNTGIIPYVEIGPTNDILPIECIIVGPGPHQKRNEASLRQWLATSAYAKVEVLVSDIPYRNW